MHACDDVGRLLLLLSLVDHVILASTQMNYTLKLGMSTWLAGLLLQLDSLLAVCLHLRVHIANRPTSVFAVEWFIKSKNSLNSTLM
jgi:hypothetical protein